jgi:KDO2-lipid IV(A) lauroyltransferase
VKAAISEAFRPHAPDVAPASDDVRRPAHAEDAMSAAWLERLFWLAERAPWTLRMLRKLASRVALKTSVSVRAGTLSNAAHILGESSSQQDRIKFAQRVIEHFILFCHDVGQAMRMTPEQLAARVERIEGHENYAAARAMRRGAIVLTAHMGSFEVGMAQLRRQDARIHVVFRRDAFGRFETMRSALRAKLGVIEAPVDDGWTIWMRLRDALFADEVVAVQGDRVMPGQKGERVKVLGSDMMLPAGPAKLALATGAPIVPVFSVRERSGKTRLCVEPAIVIERGEPGGVDRAMREIADVIGKYVRAHGDQWLLLQPAWCDNEEVSA